MYLDNVLLPVWIQNSVASLGSVSPGAVIAAPKKFRLSG